VLAAPAGSFSRRFLREQNSLRLIEWPGTYFVTTGSWTQAIVAGHAADIYEPATPNPAGFVVLYLHGVHLTRLAGQPGFEESFDRHGLRVIAPVTQRSWWTDKICQEFDPSVSAEKHVLNSVLPYIEERWGAKPPSIGLLGTSMGGQGVLRFAFKHPNKFPVVAAISPAIDYQLRWQDGDETLPLMYPDPEAARQDTATLHVHPLNWPRNMWFCCDPADHRWHNSSDKLRMKLAAIGIPYEADLETSGGGHSFTYYNRMAPAAIQFLLDRLQKERRRVV